ncbi:MAG: hypothetical protein QXT43_01345 [Candidatus Micrarchaeaceae archaeon]
MHIATIGIGGNALLSPKGKQNILGEFAATGKIAKSIAKLSYKYKTVVTHGNGTQVGDELLKNLNTKARALPLYLLNAETQASIGSVLENAINSRGPKTKFCTVLTHVLVSEDDPAFAKPTKQIGPFYSKDELERELKREKFSYIEKRGMFRRVVASPAPKKVLELEVIRHLLKSFGVVCGGGGGIPLFKKGSAYAGANAVIDKDLTTQLIANGVGSERLVLLTNVDFVYGSLDDKSTAIKRIHAGELKGMLGLFEEGTIRPKVEAAIRFIERGGKLAQIGNINAAERVLLENYGTCIIK